MLEQNDASPTSRTSATRLPRWDLIAGVALAVVVALASLLAPSAGVRALHAAISAAATPDTAAPTPADPPIAKTRIPRTPEPLSNTPLQPAGASVASEAAPNPEGSPPALPSALAWRRAAAWAALRCIFVRSIKWARTPAR